MPFFLYKTYTMTPKNIHDDTHTTSIYDLTMNPLFTNSAKKEPLNYSLHFSLHIPTNISLISPTLDTEASKVTLISYQTRHGIRLEQHLTS
jgi:hypothetical protein